MVRVTIEIWPGGDSTRAYALATANIANVSNFADVSDYAVTVSEGYNPLTHTRPWSHRGHILRHDRNASVWVLIAKIATLAAEEAAKSRR